MLTTIGDKIVEIRPKQVIESTIQIDNAYLVPLNKKSDIHYKPVKKEKQKNEKPREHTSSDTKASS